jgi:uroporphyrinogen-III decarboxylase
MTSKERILAVLDGRPADHVPLTFWCFGFPAPPGLAWKTDGREAPYWYSKRLEHIHTLPHPWELEDEFKRAEAWLSLGVDDVLEVSVPWSQDPEVKSEDSVIPPGAGGGGTKKGTGPICRNGPRPTFGRCPASHELDLSPFSGTGGDPRYPVMVRRYDTPSGPLRHAVKQTGGEAPGWPLQPDHVPLFEDYNVSRAVEHAVASPADVPTIRHLFMPPDESQRRWFAERTARMREFARRKGLLVQAWAAFGMDAAVWLTGTQGAVMMAVDAPEAFARLIEIIAETDYARTELAATTEGVDLVCQRGWYSSTDFWSPALFEKYVYPHVAELAALVHRHGKKFGYTLTTGVGRLGPRLADAGVDLLYYVDPVLDKLSPEQALQVSGGRMTVVGGTNAISLASGDTGRIRREVRQAMEVLGPTNRFILSATDALFPDTPWEGVRQMIETWRECW